MARRMSVVLAVIVLLSVSAVDKAASSTISDSFFVYNPQGGVYAGGSITELQEQNVGPATWYINAPDLADPNMVGFATGLFEGSGPQLSDIYGVINIQNGFYLAFSSDSPEGSPPSNGLLGNPVSFAQELPQGNDATIYLNPNLRDQGYTARFTSDAQTPEPTTVILLGLGGAAIFALGRRSRRA